MTKSQSSIQFFMQEYCGKHPLTHEEIQSRLTILRYVEEAAQDTVQVQPPLREIFAQWRKACQSKPAQKSRSTRDLSLLFATLFQILVLETQVESESDQAVLERIKNYFQSDRSSTDLLKLSNQLFTLAKGYTKGK